jgi:drug/metabolite transporter, DME family
LLIVSSQLPLTLDQLVILVVMGAVQLGLPYFLFSKGLQSVSLQEASLIALIEPVINPIWVALAVGEIPSAATLSGGAMILLGLGVRYVSPLLNKSAEPAGRVS